MVLEVRIVAVLLRELDEVTLRRRHEREAAVRDVPEYSSVTSRLAGAREGRESFAVDVGHNASKHLVGQDDDGARLREPWGEVRGAYRGGGGGTKTLIKTYFFKDKESIVGLPISDGLGALGARGGGGREQN